MRKHIIRLLLPTALLAALAALPSPSRPAMAAGSLPDKGLVCITSPTNTFNLTTNSGSISTSDGNTIWMWGMSIVGQPFQHPSPNLCVNEGATVTIALSNTDPNAAVGRVNEPVSLIFPGQTEVLADGQPSQPTFDGAGAMTSLAPMAAVGGTVSYSFVADKPGTYLYESGTAQSKQVQMGLFGALIVRPSAGSTFVYNRADSQFKLGEEYIALLSEIDPAQHQAVELNQPFDYSTYHARYWLINGRTFPDTIAPNGASWLPDQPYGALAHIEPYSAANPLPAALRYLSVGTEDYPFHPHGNHERVIGRDGNPLADGTADLSYERFSIPVGPGQTWDALFNWSDAESYNSISNPLPVTLPNQGNTTYGQYYSGNPYLGNRGTLPTGQESYNQCGEYYHIAHNHALNQITNWGTTMSGQITYVRIDPPGGCH